MKTNFTKSFSVFIILIALFLNAKTNSFYTFNNKISNKEIKQNRKLVYLYVSNGGMVGYFNDGSVIACPQCDFTRSNLLSMSQKRPFRKWNLKKPDDFISFEEDNGWVLINYKWKVKAP